MHKMVTIQRPYSFPFRGREQGKHLLSSYPKGLKNAKTDFTPGFQQASINQRKN